MGSNNNKIDYKYYKFIKIPISKTNNDLSKLLDLVEYNNENIILTRNGIEIAAISSLDVAYDVDTKGGIQRRKRGRPKGSFKKK